MHFSHGVAQKAKELRGLAEVAGETSPLRSSGKRVLGHCLPSELNEKCLLQTFLIKILPLLMPLHLGWVLPVRRLWILSSG